MAAIAFDIPEDITAVADGLRAFADAEVMPRHAAVGVRFRVATGPRTHNVQT